jgi:RNA polymerase sigma-70 factor (ECF subfamily)
MNALQRRIVHGAMVRLAEGDRAAFDAVFAGLWPELLGFVRSAMGGHPDAEDLAQQTLLKVFFRISEFDTTRDGVAWAFGIAIYEVRTLRRTRQRRREVSAEAADPSVDTRPSPEAVLIETDLRRALAESLGELTDADRAVLLPEQNPEISASAAAWRKRRQRALARLRSVWRNRDA